MSEQRPKSALEIAMERLRQQDLEEGTAPQPRSDKQKAEIAEIRSFYDAKLAHLDVMHTSSMGSTWDPAARADLEHNHRRERERLTRERDVKIERARLDPD